MCQQQGVNINESGKKTDFIAGENSNYYQIRNAYLQLELSIQKKCGHFDKYNKGVIRLVKIGLDTVLKQLP